MAIKMRFLYYSKQKKMKALGELIKQDFQLDNINAFDLEHSTINYKGTDITPLSLTLIITIVENNSNMVYDVNIDMLGDDMVAYRISSAHRPSTCPRPNQKG